MKAMLVVAFLEVFNPDGSSNVIKTQYNTWENCLIAKGRVIAQTPNIDLNLRDRPVESDLVAYCVPIEDKEEQQAKKRQVILENLMKFFKAIDESKKNDPLTKE